MSYEVLGIGTPLVDTILLVSRDYLQNVPGEKEGMQPVDNETFHRLVSDSGASPTIIPGGSGSNVIRGLAKLGHTCALVGKIGKDKAAQFYLDHLDKEQITPLFFETSTPTAQVLALVDPDGLRTFRCLLNASVEMRAEDLDPTYFQQVKLVHIEGYSLLCSGLTKRAIALAKSQGALVSFDLSSFEIVNQHKKDILELLKEVDILFGNEAEVLALTGEGPERAAEILSGYCSVVVVLQGKKGCLAIDQKLRVFTPALLVSRPLDTTGAGDLFAAGFLHQYLLGSSLEECTQLGVRLGAAVVQVLGAEIPEKIWKDL